MSLMWWRCCFAAAEVQSDIVRDKSSSNQTDKEHQMACPLKNPVTVSLSAEEKYSLLRVALRTRSGFYQGLVFAGFRRHQECNNLSIKLFRKYDDILDVNNVLNNLEGALAAMKDEK